MGVVKTGNTPSRAVKEYYGDFIEWIKSDNISMAALNPAPASEYLSSKGFKVGRSVGKNSILVTCIAGSTNSIGNVVLTDRKVSFNQQINSLTPSDDFDPLFVYGLFKQSKKLIQDRTTQGMKRIITKSIFENLEMIKPPFSLQQQFASIVADTERLRQKQQESERELEHLFQALLQQYFGAEVKPVIKAVHEVLSIAAEPAVSYRTATSSIPENKRGFAKYVLAGKIISECRSNKDFTHIKFQKLQHLAEYLLEEDLEQNFYYQAAGPYDNKLMHNLDNKMQQQKWFVEEAYVFQPLAKASEIEEHFNRYFNSKKPLFEKLMRLLGNRSEDQCEIVSTLFAVWNDMLILKEPVTDTKLITRFYQWSDRKKKYTKGQLEKALLWMRKEELVPKGFGPLIKHKKK